MIVNHTINKVINSTEENTESLLDLTADSVSPENLLLNKTAHNSEGEGIVGEMPEGGTNDYNALNNRPQINGNLLTGNKTGGQLGLQNRVLASTLNIGGQTIGNVEGALSALNESKSDLVNGKVPVNELPVYTPVIGSIQSIGGIVPPSSSGDEDKYLRADGTWAKPSGGGGGVSDYDDLTNRPKVNGTTLSGDKTGTQLGLQNIVLSSALSIGGQTVTEVEEALQALNENSSAKDNFIGTKQEWEALTPEEQAKYNTMDFLGDSSSGGGGHTIVDEEGTELTQRNKLQFKGAVVSDDETNDETIVDIDPTLRDAEVIEGKNLLNPNNYSPSGTESYGVTYTVNADGSVKANGTADASHVSGFSLLAGKGSDLQWLNGKKINGCTGGSVNTFSINVVLAQSPWTTYLSQTEDDEVISGIPNDTSSIQVLIRVQKSVPVNNKVFYPMISVDGGDYEPFYVPVKDAMLRRSEQRVLGAKNLLENNATTRTIDGITLTVNSDKSITANGTRSSATNVLYLQLMNKVELPSGKYIYSGCPSGGAINTYHQMVNIYNSDDTFNRSEYDIGSGVEFNVQNGQKVSLYAPRIATEFTDTVTNLTFKPMLRLASDPDNTYVPYAMTNRELTEGKLDSSVAGVDEDETTAKVAHEYGTHFVKNGKYCRALDYIGVGATFSLGTNYIEETITNAYDTKYITSSTDLNTLFDPGYYMWANSVPVNTPDSVSYCIMRVIVSSGISRIQIIYCEGKMYQRIYTSQGWQSWYKFTGTVVS